MTGFSPMVRPQDFWCPLRTHIDAPVRPMARPVLSRVRHFFVELAGWERRSTVLAKFIGADQTQCGSKGSVANAAVSAAPVRKRTS